MDDRQPYVYRTTDYGKSWKKIITGIADGHFARAVREDHQKPGLLFLGTEHGVYVSFDAGDHWQSIQLNVPDTPVRDLIVKNDDVVLGTHGRGFWILDDIGPLRQMNQSDFDKELVVFQPSDAIRGVYDAKVQYYLKNKEDTVKVEILDSNGALIDAFVGTKEKNVVDPNIPWWRRGGSSKPTTAKGVNEFTWDLRYKGATSFDGMIIWSARPTRGPKAPLGKYEVRITASDQVVSKHFNVNMNPNWKGITSEDLDEQFELASKIRDKTSITNEAVIDIRKMKAHIKGAKDEDISESASQFVEAISEIEQELYQVKNQSNQDPLNFPIKLNNRFASLRRSVENGDAKPTDGAYKVFEELSKNLEGHLNNLQKVKDLHLPTLNAKLEAKGMDKLK